MIKKNSLYKNENALKIISFVYYFISIFGFSSYVLFFHFYDVGLGGLFLSIFILLCYIVITELKTKMETYKEILENIEEIKDKKPIIDKAHKNMVAAISGVNLTVFIYMLIKVIFPLISKITLLF